MFQALLETLTAGLKLWDDKEKTKYVDKKMQIEKDYYVEYNKGPDLRSDAVLDNLEFELRVLAAAFAAGVGKPNTPN